MTLAQRMALVSTTSILAMMFPAAGFAQPMPPAVADAASPSAIEDIVVTARRREENLEKVPVSIAAINGDALRQKNIVTPNDLQYAVPGLTLTGVQGSREDPPISMRGQGQTFGGALPGVQSYFNEVPIPGSMSSLYDIENVQVLKGPQGTLFGRNTTGGAILYQAKRPTDRLEGYVAARIGNLGYREIEGALNVPISEGIALRVAGDILRRDGYTLDLTTGRKLDNQHKDNWRVSLRLKPGETITSDFVYQGYDVNQNGGSLILYSAPANGVISAFFPQYQLQSYFAQQLANGPRTTWTVPGYPADFRRKNWLIANTTAIELGSDIELKNIAGYQRTTRSLASNFIGIPQPVLFQAISERDPLNPNGEKGGASQFSDELHLSGTSFDNALTWVVGGSYIHEKPAGVVSDTLGTLGASAANYRARINLQSTITDDYGVFGQATLKFTDALSATAGIRYSVNKQRLVFSSISQQLVNRVGAGPASCGVVGLPAATPVASCLLRLRTETKKPSWNLSLDYQVSPDLLFYVASRRGFKAGGFNASVADPARATYGAERITDYEAGVKLNTRVSDDLAIRINAAAYASKVKDIQRYAFFVENGVGQTVTRNAGDAKINGVELQATAVVMRMFDLSLNYAYTDASITPLASIGAGAGTSFAGVPKHAGSGTILAHLPIDSALGDATVSITGYRQSLMAFVDNINTEPQAFQGGYTLINLRADWKGLLGTTIDAGLFMNNVGKRLYAVDNVALNAGLGASTRSYSVPRTYGAELRYRF